MNKEKAPAFQFYPATFLADVGMMTTEEVGAYMLLICYCWREGSLPDDSEELATLARLSVKKFQSLWEKKLKRRFTLNDEGQWASPRLEVERLKQARNRKLKQKAANERWNRNKEPNPSDAPAMHMHSTRNANGLQEPMHVECSSTIVDNYVDNLGKETEVIPPPTPAPSDVVTDERVGGSNLKKASQQNIRLVDLSSRSQATRQRTPETTGGVNAKRSAFPDDLLVEYGDAHGLGAGWYKKDGKTGNDDRWVQKWLDNDKRTAIRGTQTFDDAEIFSVPPLQEAIGDDDEGIRRGLGIEQGG